MVPLGLSGVFAFLNAYVAKYSQIFAMLTVGLLIYSGWQVYRQGSTMGTKILYWLVVFVSLVFVNYLPVANWFQRTFIY